MGIDYLTLSAAKGYTDESLLGGGSLVGKNVTISSITPIEGGNKVTFSYTLDDGTVKTSSMNVMDGKDGKDGTNGKNGKDGQPGKDGTDGIGISKIEKIGTVDLVDTYRITFTDNSTFDYEVTNGKDGQGGEGASKWSEISDKPFETLSTDFSVENGELKVVGGTGGGEENVQSDWNETDDTADGFIKNKPTIPTKVSQLENDSNYLSSIPEEYVTDTELEAKGYLTEHQDISGKVDKVEGKSLISDTEIARLASVDNYDDTDIKAEIAKKADTTSIPSKVSALENDSKYQTESDVTTTLTDYATKTYVGEQITNAEHLKREIVTVLPSDTEASDNIIYMLKVESATGNDKYQEYMKIDGTVQMVGDTSVDLTDYAKSVDIPTTVAELTDSTDYAKKTDLHSHTNKTVLDGITEEKVTAWDKAQENVIETVKVNNQEIIADENKAVNIDLTGYAEHDEIVGENLIPYPYKNTSKSINGVEFVDNGDGTVTATGTSTSDAFFYLSLPMTLKAGTYVFSNNGLVDSAKVHMQIYLYKTPFTTIKSTTSSVNPFTIESDCDVTIRLNVLSGETVDNYIFKPMLEVGSIVHEYQPYNLSRNALRTDIADVTELASRVDNQFATASGDSITVNDSVDGKLVELCVKGNSFQNSYTGKNLIAFPYYDTSKTVNGITFTVNSSDGSVTANGTATSNAIFFFRYREDNPLTAGNYVLSGTPKGGSKTTYYQWFGIWDGTTNVYGVYDVGDSANIALTDELCSQSLVIGCYVYSGATVSNLTFYPQLELGDTATEYEPYVGGVPAPSPLYPQEITSVGDDGSLVIKSRGKNLIPYPYDDGVRTNVGLTMTSLPNGMVNVNGTNTGVSGLFNFNYPTRSLIKLDPSKTYAFFNPLKTDVKNQITLGIRWYLESDEISVQTGTNTSIAAHGNSNGAVIRSGFSYAYVYLYGYNSGKTFNNVLFAPMLVEVNEDGTYPTEYEIYKSSTSTIPLSEPLRAIGDVKDEITYQDGKWGVLRRIGSIILDGTEENCSASTINDSETSKCYKVEGKLNKSDVGNYITSYFSSHFEVVNSPTLLKTQGKTLLNVSETNSALYLSLGTDIATIDDFKNFLSTNKPEFVYKLATPVFAPFADQTLPYLSTYDGVTNISNDDALSAEMTVKYPTTDASGVGSRNESRIAELAKDTDDKFDELNRSLDALEYSDIAGGKNLWSLESSYTTTADTWALLRIEMPLKAGTYILSYNSTTSAEFSFTNTDEVAEDAVHATKNNSFTLSKDTKYVYLWINTGTVSDIQIEKGSTVTEYEPYIPSVKMLKALVNFKKVLDDWNASATLQLYDYHIYLVIQAHPFENRYAYVGIVTSTGNIVADIYTTGDKPTVSVSNNVLTLSIPDAYASHWVVYQL